MRFFMIIKFRTFNQTLFVNKTTMSTMGDWLTIRNVESTTD